MKLPQWLRVVGDQSYRNKDCPREEAEQITFFAELRKRHPGLWSVAIHPKNEGRRTAQQANRDRATGSLNKGASDVIIPCCQPIIIEMKRQDHTVSSWEDGQQEYLESAQTLGARVCVALGWRAAMQFVDECVGNEKPLG